MIHKFEKYPELSEMMQEYAAHGRFTDWQKFTDALNNALCKAENLPISGVSASTVKSLHTALTNLLQATDDEGWNNEGEDWEEQSEARKAIARIPKEYLR